MLFLLPLLTHSIHNLVKAINSTLYGKDKTGATEAAQSPFRAIVTGMVNERFPPWPRFARRIAKCDFSPQELLILRFYDRSNAEIRFNGFLPDLCQCPVMNRP